MKNIKHSGVILYRELTKLIEEYIHVKLQLKGDHLPVLL